MTFISNDSLNNFIDVDSWWTSLKGYVEDKTNLTSWEELIDPDVFPTVLSDFLFDSSGSRYKANFRFDGELVCNQPIPNIMVYYTKSYLVQVSLYLGDKVQVCVPSI